MSKKIVRYVGTPSPRGRCVCLTPIDHPDSENVSNTRPVLTSPLVLWDKTTGVIETLNTVYVPDEPFAKGFQEGML